MRKKLVGLFFSVLAFSFLGGGVSAAVTDSSSAAAEVSVCDYGQGAHLTLGVGSSGPLVKHAQCMINRVTYMQLAVDGIYGPATRTGVEHFQANANLTVDGIVGPNTWSALHAWNS
ncbi:peptidoglycan hydrolase-like protein with peptidoglycan-binding domain [Actinopolyspora lacussalsi]|nr:peptidoglycan hydrolase-like protein with peptidoglycan-binding domain [Actinopolyspora lacussalsi]